MRGEPGPAGASDYVQREDIGPLLLRQFVKFDPDYVRRRDPLKEELQRLNDRLDEFIGAGHSMWRSDQIRTEANWLLNYRADWKRLTRRIDDLRASLNDREQGVPRQGLDGSWGGYCEEWYRKLEPTVDELQFNGPNKPPVKPLFFLTRLADPMVLQDYFWGLQISDIAATGENHRDQLGASQAAISQLFYKKDLCTALKSPDLAFTVTTPLMNAYEDFMNQTQHPRTGFWGPWYRVDGQLLQVQDLSYTFHQVTFRKGEVRNLDRIVDTTLRIQPLRYPNGWVPEDGTSKFSNHHNYDVVKLLFFGREHLQDPDLRHRALSAMQAMLQWCLTESVDGNEFVTEDDAFEALYFGVRFLDRVGYWDSAQRFWEGRAPLPVPEGLTPPIDLARRLQEGLHSFANWDKIERGETIRDILKAAIETSGKSG